MAEAAAPEVSTPGRLWVKRVAPACTLHVAVLTTGERRRLAAHTAHTSCCCTSVHVFLKLQPTSGSGRFYYHNGARYDGEWKVLNAAPPPDPNPPAKGAKKPAKDEPPPPPAEPPKRVRHGKGGLGAWTDVGAATRVAVRGQEQRGGARPPVVCSREGCVCVCIRWGASVESSEWFCAPCVPHHHHGRRTAVTTLLAHVATYKP